MSEIEHVSDSSHGYQPELIYSERGRLVWQSENNTEEADQTLRINNLLGIFLQAFPTFKEDFLDDDWKVYDDKKIEAATFIYEQIGGYKRCRTLIGAANFLEIVKSNSQNSHAIAIQKAFALWGIDFQVSESRPGAFFLLSPHEDTVREERIKRRTEAIEKRVEDLIREGQLFDHKNLLNAGLASLEDEISNNYPGGFVGLMGKYDLPGRRVRGIWTGEEGLKKMREEAASFYQQHHTISEGFLITSGYAALAAAINKNYPGGMHQLREDLDIPQIRREDGYWTPETIEEEAIAFYGREGQLSGSLLQQRGLSSLANQISDTYPGGMRALKIKLNLELKFMRRDWTADTVRHEVENFVKAHGGLSQKLLANNRRLDLLYAIQHYYPGGLKSIKIDLGIDQEQEEWTTERVEREALAFLQQHGDITSTLLREKGSRTLRYKIAELYPGSFPQLRINLGLKPNRKDGYWTPETIEEEARAFYEEHGSFSQTLLKEEDRQDLLGAIMGHYPGKLRALQSFLGIEPSQKLNYWTPETIEEEARAFYEQYGGLTSALLTKEDRGDLLGAIGAHYEGGLTQLQINLEIGPKKKKDGYWTPETIEEEARLFYEKYGGLSIPLLKENGKGDLAGAIYIYKYPGGLTALKDKIIGQQETVDPEDNFWDEYYKFLEDYDGYISPEDFKELRGEENE